MVLAFTMEGISIVLLMLVGKDPLLFVLKPMRRNWIDRRPVSNLEACVGRERRPSAIGDVGGTHNDGECLAIVFLQQRDGLVGLAGQAGIDDSAMLVEFVALLDQRRGRQAVPLRGIEQLP